MASKYDQTTSDADARLVRAIGDPKIPGFVLERGWPHLAAAAGSGNTVQDLFESWITTPTTTRTNPKANGDAYTGTFVVSKVEARDEDFNGTSDRVAAIVESLTKVTSITTYTDLSNPFIRQGNNILYPLRSETEASALLETGEDDVIILEYRNINPSSRQACMETVTDAQLKGIADALVTGTPWIYESRYFKEEDDKTATFTVKFRDYAHNGTADDGDGSIISEIQKAVAGSRREVNTQVKEHITPAVADTIMAAETGWDPPSGFQLMKLVRRDHEDGSATVYQICTKSVTWTFNTSADDVFEVEFWGHKMVPNNENEQFKLRKITEHTERFYTNTEARAEAWALTADISTGYSWSDNSYIAANGVQDERALYVKGHITQAIRGDYRWISYRTSKLQIFAQDPQAETEP